MIQCICSKCGALATSKNPTTRNVFLDDQDLSDKEFIFPSYVENRNSEQGTTIVIQKPLWQTIELDKETAEKYLRFIANSLLCIVEDGKALQFLCEHDFVPANDEEAAKITVW